MKTRQFIFFTQLFGRVQLLKIFWTVRLAEHFCRKIGRWRRTRWMLGNLSFFLRNEAKIQFIRIQRAYRIPYENRRLTQCATHTRKSIFFTRDLARIQLSRYQATIQLNEIGISTAHLYVISSSLYPSTYTFYFNIFKPKRKRLWRPFSANL